MLRVTILEDGLTAKEFNKYGETPLRKDFISEEHFEAAWVMWAVAEDKRRTFDIEPQETDCPNCGGTCSITVAGCCNNPYPSGECCGEPIPVQDGCPYCNAEGVIQIQYTPGTIHEAEIVNGKIRIV